MRKIIHVDMDAFYASVEQRDFPELRGKSLAVGGSPDGRGVVAAASYEARKFGVRSAMSSRSALQRCPDLIFVRPRFEVYREVSQAIRSIFSRYTDLIEPLSLDEAYLDVTEDKLSIGSAIEIARAIKSTILDELNLTASAGVSVNKFVAKIASDYEKPNGLTFIGPSKVISFLEALPIEKFHGVGQVTAKKMNQMGIFRGVDLKRFSQTELSQHFGKSGKFFYQIVRGIDDRPVRTNRERKSVGVEDTFETDLYELHDLHTEIDRLCRKLVQRLESTGKRGKTLTLKVKFSDFSQVTRSMTVPDLSTDFDPLVALFRQLLDKVDIQERKIRLLGVTLSNFSADHPIQELGGQLRLF
ncbi:MAG: DNA polymerase IV [Sphingobacteriaceae bacterium]